MECACVAEQGGEMVVQGHATHMTLTLRGCATTVYQTIEHISVYDAQQAEPSS